MDAADVLSKLSTNMDKVEIVTPAKRKAIALAKMIRTKSEMARDYYAQEIERALREYEHRGYMDGRNHGRQEIVNRLRNLNEILVNHGGDDRLHKALELVIKNITD